MMNLNFKSFLLTENRQILANDIGQILTYLQSVQDNTGMQKSRDLKDVPKQVQKMVHSVLEKTPSNEDVKYVQKLSKIAGALMMSVDHKYKDQNLDVKQLIPTAVSELEKIVSDMGVPINALGVDQQTPEKNQTGVDKPLKPQKATPVKTPKNDQSAPPPKPQTMEKSAPATPPEGGTGIDDYAQPLGGSGHGFDAF